MEKNNAIEDTTTIEYRLNSIEKSIGELKSYIIETKLQQKDIDLLYKTIQNLENENKNLNNRIGVLEKKPGNMFENIISYVASVFIGGIVGYFLYKLGIHN